MSTPAPKAPPNKVNTGLAPPPPGKTKLITERGTTAIPSAVCETDARTALKRGMKEYIEQLSIEHQQRDLSFERVFDVWPDQEEKAVYPSAIVYTTGDGMYDASSFTPSINPECKLEDGRFLTKKSEFTIDLQIELWATDAEERVGLVKMLEDALSPVDWQYGVTLELPHYFNQRAQYELTTSSYPDTEAEVFRRNRLAIMTLSSRVPVVSLRTYPLASPKFQLTVEDGVDC